MLERKKKLNCGNTIAKIRRGKKFAIVAIQLPKYERNSKKRNLEFQQKFRKFWGPQGERISGGRRENLVKIGCDCF